MRRALEQLSKLTWPSKADMCHEEKSMRSQLIRVVIGSALLLASALFVSAQQQYGAKDSEEKLTKAEAKELSRSQKPQDHLRLAAYFRHEAREQEKMAEIHEEMLIATPGSMAGPVAVRTELQMQSRDFADNARRAARSALDMAREQEAIAARLQQYGTKPR